ncbi:MULTISPECIES: type B 50S ribosomal protein L31 [Saccharopolyspora]|uniref:Large ribosomal subunit protein bL31B n=3 Tax=Saccharopolyspora TaxID=1835 RepID=A0A4R4VPH0_9PSEU|nr:MULTISPECIES: type B 50S ribosomal protein L31 [Saccharopolyspora]MBQ0925892.1 type B 50S ribosomal protein L31 [Saccharopolyspora endophytica]TDD07041.1 type B 50S ribosomal protein L31 [Saccharopolyspora terrae]TDD91945.1 type B 50S ribosomal protein L31 [Saccharopolyspora karakumensis]
MKPDIHPRYEPVVFQDRTTGKSFLTRSTATSDARIEWEDGNTYPLITIDVTAYSHPFWTGNQRVMDTQGRVEKFRRRYGDRRR